MKTNKNRFDAIVIGGSGFIGEALVGELVFDGETVASISRHIPENKREGVEYFALDVGSEEEQLSAVLTQGKDIFILIGQNYSGFDSVREESIFRHLLETFEQLSDPKRIFFCSSVLVYGDTRLPVTEDSVLNPIDSYSRFKKTCEEMLLAQKSHHQKIILRLANVYGTPQNKGFIGLLLGKINRDDVEPIRVNGDGKQARDYIFLDDLIQALLVIRHKVSAENIKHDIINVVTGKSYTLLEVIETVSRVLNQLVPFEITSVPVLEVNQSLISNEKLCTKYGYAPNTSLKEGISKTWQRYENNGRKNTRGINII